MSRKQFEDILCYLHVDYDSPAVAADPWKPVRHFIDAFNINMVAKVVPVYKICVDESMCSWRGCEGGMTGMPHVTKIPRKPEGVGAELKDVAGVATNLLLHLEIMEGMR